MSGHGSAAGNAGLTITTKATSVGPVKIRPFDLLFLLQAITELSPKLFQM